MPADQVITREDLERACAEMGENLVKARKRIANQRRELRRLNTQIKYLWCAFRAGYDSRDVTKLRGIMNLAFGHEAVRKAEHEALDREREQK